MEYQVPQFIEVEDKIFGPFTFKQFVYVAGGAGVCAIAFVYLPLLIAIIVSIPVAALAGALAFYRVNNKPFVDILEAGFGYLTGGRLYLWNKDADPKKNTAPVLTTVRRPEPAPQLGVSQNRLHDLAWSLDIKDTGNPNA